MPAVVRGGRRQSTRPAPRKPAQRRGAGRKAPPGKLSALGKLDLGPRTAALSLVVAAVAAAGIFVIAPRGERIAASLNDGFHGQLANLGLRLDQVHVQGASAEAAPASRARLDMSTQQAIAASFSGSVMLAPATPLRASLSVKSAGPASIAAYVIAMPACLANAAWMRGDCEWEMGDPKTAYCCMGCSCLLRLLPMCIAPGPQERTAGARSCASACARCVRSGGVRPSASAPHPARSRSVRRRRRCA